MLPGGLRVVTERVPSVRSASVGVWVNVGSRDEGPTVAGAAHFLEHLLFKATPSRDSVQIALTAAPGTEMGYSSSDLEFGAALTPQGPLVWCWYAGPGGRTGRVEEAEVAVVPGEAFGTPGFWRLSYALGDEDLIEGVERIAALLQE